jgi:hypothetical protein
VSYTRTAPDQGLTPGLTPGACPPNHQQEETKRQLQRQQQEAHAMGVAPADDVDGSASPEATQGG